MADLTLDFSQAEATFGAALRQMAELTRLPLRVVIRAEAGSILKACAGATKVAVPEKVEGSARMRLIRDLGLGRGNPVVISSGRRNAGVAGKIAAKSTGPRSTGKYRVAYSGSGRDANSGVPRNIHWRDSDWTDIEEARFDYNRVVKKAMADALRAIGLSRQSWIQIGDALGIRLENVPGGRLSASAIAKARKALASNGNRYMNGRAIESQSNTEYYVDLVNGLPSGSRLGFPRILLTAIRNRTAHFVRTLNMGVFDSMADVARQFPGFYVNPGGN